MAGGGPITSLPKHVLAALARSLAMYSSMPEEIAWGHIKARGFDPPELDGQGARMRGALLKILADEVLAESKAESEGDGFEPESTSKDEPKKERDAKKKPNAKPTSSTETHVTRAVGAADDDDSSSDDEVVSRAKPAPETRDTDEDEDDDDDDDDDDDRAFFARARAFLCHSTGPPSSSTAWYHSSSSSFSSPSSISPAAKERSQSSAWSLAVSTKVAWPGADLARMWRSMYSAKSQERVGDLAKGQFASRLSRWAASFRSSPRTCRSKRCSRISALISACQRWLRVTYVCRKAARVCVCLTSVSAFFLNFGGGGPFILRVLSSSALRRVACFFRMVTKSFFLTWFCE